MVTEPVRQLADSSPVRPTKKDTDLSVFFIVVFEFDSITFAW